MSDDIFFLRGKNKDTAMIRSKQNKNTMLVAWYSMSGAH